MLKYTRRENYVNLMLFLVNTVHSKAFTRKIHEIN